MNVSWSSVTKNPITKEYTLGRRTGDQLMLLYQQNYTIKVFEMLRAELKREFMSRRRALSLKMDLFNEYSHPRPFPADMFLRLPTGSPSQAYLMIGQTGTGKIIVALGFRNKSA